MPAILQFNQIGKHYKTQVVLDDLNLSIDEGEIFGLIGLNGAGKTTLMKILLGLVTPAKGEILFKGKNIEAQDIRSKISFLSENFTPPQNLKIMEFLKAMAILCNSKENLDDLLELVDLKRQKNKRLKNFSRGMVQRLGLVCVLLKNPDLIVLDEPTLGLDVCGQADVARIMTGLNQKGKTIFFSSHILSQVTKVSSRIGVLNRGKIVFDGTIANFMTKQGADNFESAFIKCVGTRRGGSVKI